MSHAMLSPSSAARWIQCPPSAKINAEAGDRDTVFTREGTLAHALAELKARKAFLTGIGPKKYQAAHDKLTQDEMWQDEMEGHTDRYLEILKDLYAEFPEPPHVAVEQRVDFSEWVPGGFGTADCAMVGGGVLHVIDFKYGKGVPVSAEANPQMMLYALGALAAYDLIYDLDTVKMTIIQPRLSGDPDTWETTVDDLSAWAEDVVRPAAALAAKGEGEFAEGDWCRFCAIRASCRARAAAQTVLEDFGFRLPHGLEAASQLRAGSAGEHGASRPNGLPQQQPPTLTDEEVGRALDLGKRLSKWLADLEEYALTACLDGREIPGFKAVAGRSVRAWTDQDAAFAAARENGVPDEMLWERRPVTLAGLEKIMGKRQFLDAMAPYVIAPPGKPTLVPADDKRPAITNRPTVEDDFGENE